MDTLLEFLNEVKAMLPTLKLMDILDILVVAVIIYALFMMVHSTGASRIARSVLIILLLTVITDVLNMYLLNYLLDSILGIGLIVLVIIFQPELRRMLERIGSRRFREFLVLREEKRDIDRVIARTVSACESLSRERIGALIVFERTVLLQELEKTGTILDAQVSSELLRNIFFTNAALHDGAVIIRNERISSAGCVLPLTQNRNISTDLGTRHRAGIGVSEMSDAVVVIVSEETGTISVAVGGMLKRHLAPQTLEKLLNNELAPKRETRSRNPLHALKNKRKERNDTDAES